MRGRKEGRKRKEKLKKENLEEKGEDGNETAQDGILLFFLEASASSRKAGWTCFQPQGLSLEPVHLLASLSQNHLDISRRLGMKGGGGGGGVVRVARCISSAFPWVRDCSVPGCFVPDYQGHPQSWAPSLLAPYDFHSSTLAASLPLILSTPPGLPAHCRQTCIHKM